jgi:hypothetical protein
MDVRVTLWDETTISGRLEQDMLQVQLDSGVAVQVPLVLIDAYDQPIPQPSSAVMGRIRELVAELNAEDWQRRDRAEEQLTRMGVSVIGVLQNLVGEQSPEARQRIEQILVNLRAQLTEDAQRSRR